MLVFLLSNMEICPTRLPKIIFLILIGLLLLREIQAHISLYTIVRIKSIFSRFKENGGQITLRQVHCFRQWESVRRHLMLQLARYYEAAIENGFCRDRHLIRSVLYIYEVSNAFNSFYHDTKILSEEDPMRKQSYIRLITLAKRVLETSIDLLGFTAPDKM